MKYEHVNLTFFKDAAAQVNFIVFKFLITRADRFNKIMYGIICVFVVSAISIIHM